MKRMIFLVIVVCILGMVGCGSTDNSSVVVPPIENTDVADQTKEECWSEQDIIAMFHDIAEEEWVYQECVVISDFASDRIGAVLFQDNKRGTINVAFFDKEGYYQQSGVYAELADESDFSYLGDGSVIFKLKHESDMTYNCTLTISIDEECVNFKVESDFIQ